MDTGGKQQATWRGAVIPVSVKEPVRVQAVGRASVAPPADAPASGAGAGARVTLAGPSAIMGMPAAGSKPPEIDPRERAISAMVEWAHSGDRTLWLIEGGPGTGKTTLANDVAGRLVGMGWSAGFARPGWAAQATVAGARTGRPTLVLVDDAETRADLGDLLAALANGGNPLSVRVMVIAREFTEWWSHLLTALPEAEQRVLRTGRTVIGAGKVSVPSQFALAVRAGRPDDSGRERAALATLSKADPVSAAVLLRLAALIVALPTRVGELDAGSMRNAVRDLFNEEDGYWHRAAAEVSPAGLPEPALRSALTATAVLTTDGLSDAATVLRRVPALAVGAADRLARLSLWWHSLYAKGPDAARGPQLPGWLLDRLPAPGGSDSTGVSWTVAALDAERRSTSTLARMVCDAHRDIWPSQVGRVPQNQKDESEQRAETRDTMRRAVRAAAPVDEALAWLIQELELGHEDMDTLADAISYPTRSLGRTAVVLARRLLESAQGAVDEGAFAMELGARLSEVGRWEEAREVTDKAVATYRSLAEGDRERFLPDLATTVANLGSCLAQLGEKDEALQVTYEAVALFRELLETDREYYLPHLARGLVNLSSCLAKAGRRQPALGAAGQAVAIYRELAALHPAAFAGELEAAEHNWRVCRAAAGQPVAGRRPEGLEIAAG